MADKGVFGEWVVNLICKTLNFEYSLKEPDPANVRKRMESCRFSGVSRDEPSYAKEVSVDEREELKENRAVILSTYICPVVISSNSTELARFIIKLKSEG